MVELDAALAYLHFLFAFTVFGALASEAYMLRLPLSAPVFRLLSRADLVYGISAGALVVVGLGRVHWGAKGDAYYMHEPFFWAKMATFALVGIISIWPTIAFIRWRKAVTADPNFTPADKQLARIRTMVTSEVVLFAFIPLFAVLMARGFGT